MSKKDEKQDERAKAPTDTKSNQGVGGMSAMKEKTADKIDTSETDEVKPEDRVGGPGIDPKMSVAEAEGEQAEGERGKSGGRSKSGKKKYRVQHGSISPEGGGRSKTYQVGDVVELSDEDAKHYNELGRLAPYMED